MSNEKQKQPLQGTARLPGEALIPVQAEVMLWPPCGMEIEHPRSAAWLLSFCQGLVLGTVCGLGVCCVALCFS